MEGTAAGRFAAFWRPGLWAHDTVAGIDWRRLSLDGALGKAPPGGGKTGPNPTGVPTRSSIAWGGPTDRGEIGGKRSLPTDGRGVPLGLALAGADRNDHEPMRATIETVPVERPRPTPEQPQGRCLDQGDDHDQPRTLAARFGLTLHPRRRGEAIAAKRPAAAKAHRWGVERSPSRLDRFRRILSRREKRHLPRRAALRSRLDHLAPYQPSEIGS
jgi:putative transposase